MKHPEQTPLAITGIVRRLKHVSDRSLQLTIEIDSHYHALALKHFEDIGIGIAIAKLRDDVCQQQCQQQMIQAGEVIDA